VVDELIFYDRMVCLGWGEAVSVFFDKSTVKPIIGSESAALAAGYAPRNGLKELPFSQFSTFGAYARKC